MSKCPRCKRGELNEYKCNDWINNTVQAMVKCDSCDFYHTREYNHTGKEISRKSNYFTLEYSCVDGNKGVFIGTKEEIHKQVDNIEWNNLDGYGTKENQLRFLANTIDILKYGYCYEFKNKNYEVYNFTIDNGLNIKIDML